MITIRQLAQLAGVSPATVSKALNNQSDVSEKTKEYITELARKQGYEKKQTEQVKSTSLPGVRIGILFSDVHSTLYTNLIDRFTSEIDSKNGISLLFNNSFSTERAEMTLRYLEKSGIVDGVISLERFYEETALENISLPLVSCSALEVFQVHRYDYIYVNDATGIEAALKRMRELGHTRFGYLGEKKTTKRKEHFHRILDAMGVSRENQLAAETELRFREAGYAAMKEMLQMEKLPTAIFCAYDDIAVGAADAISEAGYSVPGDFSLFGVDNSKMIISGSKPIASIDCKVEDQVSVALALLFRRIHDRTAAIQNVNLLTDFVERDTVGPAPGWKNRPDE